jgi:thiol-disulfide isomerase/thioredoxin
MPRSQPRHPSRRHLLAALCGVTGIAQAADPTGARRRAWPAGRPTPALELPAWEAAPFRLAGARGRVVVLNFWASWCEPCRSEMPSLEGLAQRHERDGLQVLAVNFRETEGVLRRFLASMPIRLPILRDMDGAAARDWQVRIFPSTAVIARDGRAAFTVTGETDWTGAAAGAWIAPLL